MSVANESKDSRFEDHPRRTPRRRSFDSFAALVAQELGFKGRIVWDPSKPNGQPRRRLDTTRAARLFGFKGRVPFIEGLRETIAWYRASRGA